MSLSTKRKRNVCAFCGGECSEYSDRCWACFLIVRTKGVEARFWAKVDKRSGDECWGWLGALHSSEGYGSFYNGEKNDKAHRVSWKLANGAIPDGMCILHRCDNPNCVNPNHLFLGTPKDNAVDRARKGRKGDVSGEKNGWAKTTWNSVRSMRGLFFSGQYSRATLAKKFGMSWTNAESILSGKRWVDGAATVPEVL